MIDWLNDNSGAIQAVAVIVLALVTYFYMRSTGRMARAAEEQTKASVAMSNEIAAQGQRSLRPVLDLELVSWDIDDRYDEPYWLLVKARNIGEGPALNITGEVPPDEEVGFPGGREVFGSIGAGMESGARGILIQQNAVAVEYADIHARRYMSIRPVNVERGFTGSTMSVNLGDLKVVELPQ
jgi:hypothetical protein